MTDHDDDHQQLRELLGGLALRHLDGADLDRLRAHLDGCGSCREELAEIETVVPWLDALDAHTFAAPASPPADLGARIARAVSEEGARRHAESLADRRAAGRRGRRRRVLLGVAAAVVLGGGVVVGGLAGRATAPEPPTAAPVPLEPIALEAAGSLPVTVDSAGVVPHTWGVELRMEAAGFAEGEVYRAAFRDERGRLRPAGRFVGTGPDPMTCNLQAGVLREDVDAVVVVDDRGRTVLRSSL